MATNWRSWSWKFCSASWLAIGGVLARVVVLSSIAASGDCALAQITPDGTLGAESSVVTPTSIDGLSTEQIDGGATRGTNLFHSFEQFSVPTGGAAYFNNALNIQNIISRVTGRSVSNIDGLLRANGTANLFLLNPNGIIFGPNASLNIGGSFLASTANSINFADGNQFSATAPQTTPLLTVSVPLGLQFGGTAGSILNQSRATNNSSEVVGLQVQLGKTLALVGGDVSLDGGNLQARGGLVELGGVAGSGTVGLNINGNNLSSLSFPDGVAKANVSLTNQASVNVLAGGDGSIAINAQNLDVSGISNLFAGIDLGLGSVDSQAGDIKLNVIDAITVGQSSVILDGVGPDATGTTGDINITTGSLSVTDGAQLQVSTWGQGDAGNVTINARNTVSFDGVDSGGTHSAAFSVVQPSAVGNGGKVNITTGSLSVTNGAILGANTYAKGDAGNVAINARDTVSFDGVDSDGFPSAAFSTVESGAVGNGGGIDITTGSLSMTNGARLSATTDGQGNAGSVTINARDTVSFDGMGSDGYSSEAFSRVEEEALGSGGGINIMTGSLSVTNGARMSASTWGKGDAGSITINARDTVSFGGVSSDGTISAVFSTVESGAVGNGGGIDITTGSLYVTNGAQLNANTSGQGDAGSVNIYAGSTVSFDGASSDGFPSAAGSTVISGAVGNGGNVNITTGSLSVTNGVLLGAGTLGKGDAGSVNILARDTVSFNGVRSDGTPSAVGSSVEEAVGNGGKVNITTGALFVTNGAQLIANTKGQGDAGSVNIRAGSTVSFDGVSSNGVFSGAISSVEEEAVGKGGGIDIQTGSLFVTNGAGLSTSTSGQGDAGSVNINARDTVSFDNESAALSTVGSQAVGKGGGINIQTGELSFTNAAFLSASSQGSNNTAGNIVVGAGSIRLNNQAALTAETQGGQGNVILRSQDLVLRRGSKITTNATGTAEGGNINIDTDVIAALENSDISANAQDARGGRVVINAQGIFGTEFRNRLTPESDITATSDLGPEFSGTVEINTPDVDPSRGLVNLPAVPIETEVVQTCQPGGSQAQSEFIITGRGGLPPNPTEALSSDAIQVDWVTLNPGVENRSSPAPATNPTAPESVPLVEAQGWVIGNNGEVVLTASAVPVLPHSSWQTSAECRATQSVPGH